MGRHMSNGHFLKDLSVDLTTDRTRTRLVAGSLLYPATGADIETPARPITVRDMRTIEGVACARDASRG